jgi:hypothetical protein
VGADSESTSDKASRTKATEDAKCLGLGRCEDAKGLEVEVLEKRKAIQGHDHPHTLAAMANLAATYWSMGQYDDTWGLAAKVLEKTEEEGGVGPRPP